MKQLNLISAIHTATQRDYLARVVNHDKAACAEAALSFGEAYWDGDRSTGYGGYRYDGRWRPLAAALIDQFGLTNGASILDVGCGKGYLLYEFTQLLPNADVRGLDISEYAIQHAKPEIKDRLTVGTADSLPYENDSFDLVLSLNVLHNLYLPNLWHGIEEIARVGRGRQQYIVVEGYRTEVEKANLMYWQLTCRAFHTPEEWLWLFEQAGYRGAYEFIFFE